MINNNKAQARQTHNTNLLNNLARRLDVAKTNNDSNLISQLESEAHYLKFKS